MILLLQQLYKTGPNLMVFNFLDLLNHLLRLLQIQPQLINFLKQFLILINTITIHIITIDIVATTIIKQQQNINPNSQPINSTNLILTQQVQLSIILLTTLF